MQLSESYKLSLALSNNTNLINDIVYNKLLENCFSVLTGGEEIHNINTLYNSKPDVIKEVYAAILSSGAHFARCNFSKDEVLQYLIQQCSFGSSRANIYSSFYEKHKQGIEISLLNIGSHLPHITDVKWKIDYIIKSSSIDQSEGPLFEISLLTEIFDNVEDCKTHKYLNFTCTSQELQDLVCKVKDAVRHCQRLTSDI